MLTFFVFVFIILPIGCIASYYSEIIDNKRKTEEREQLIKDIKKSLKD